MDENQVEGRPVMTIEMRRRFYAEEIEAVSNLTSPAVVDALASVPRERFLPPGPWTVRSESDVGGPPRQTPDADPRHVYHNLSIAIDPARMLFNGAPGVLGLAIDRVRLGAGDRVLHIGTGMGYYTAVMAHCVGPSGRVLGIEVDERLAAEARANLASLPWVEVRHGNGLGSLGDASEAFDAIVVNAGVTHPLETWLDALAPAGRMVLPLTATMPAMGPIGKGVLVLLARTPDPAVLDARVVTFVAIYSAVGVRDEGLNAELGKTFAKSPFAPISKLRRDRHEPGPSCWFHAPMCCLSQ